MGIIRQGQEKSAKIDTDEVPFVPAIDLLEAEEKRLQSSEIFAIALALYLLVGDSAEKVSLWKQAAKLEGITRVR